MASSRELWLETDDVALIAWLDFCAESCTFDFEKTVYGHLFRTTGKHRSIASVKWKVSQLNAKYTPSSAVEKPSYGWRDMVRSGSVCMQDLPDNMRQEVDKLVANHRLEADDALADEYLQYVLDNAAVSVNGTQYLGHVSNTPKIGKARKPTAMGSPEVKRKASLESFETSPRKRSRQEDHDYFQEDDHIGLASPSIGYRSGQDNHRNVRSIRSPTAGAIGLQAWTTEPQQVVGRRHNQESHQRSAEIAKLRKECDEEIEELQAEKIKLRAQVVELEAQNRLLLSAQQERYRATNDPLETLLHLNSVEIYKRSVRMQDSSRMTKLQTIDPLNLPRAEIQKSMKDIRLTLISMTQDLDEARVAQIPVSLDGSDLEALLSVWRANSQTATSQLEDYVGRCSIVVLTRALALSALREWVFMTDFPDFTPKPSNLLSSYRDTLFVNDGWNALRSFDIAAWKDQIEKPHFQNYVIPKRAELFAARLSKALAPLFGQSSFNVEAAFETWGEEADIWDERRAHFVTFFELGLKLKAESVITKFQYVFEGHCPGTVPKSASEATEAQQRLVASLRVFAERLSNRTGQKSDALVQSRNFLPICGDVQAECLFSAEISIDTEDAMAWRQPASRSNKAATDTLIYYSTDSDDEQLQARKSSHQKDKNSGNVLKQSPSEEALLAGILDQMEPGKYTYQQLVDHVLAGSWDIIDKDHALDWEKMNDFLGLERSSKAPLKQWQKLKLRGENAQRMFAGIAAQLPDQYSIGQLTEWYCTGMLDRVEQSEVNWQKLTEFLEVGTVAATRKRWSRLKLAKDHVPTTRRVLAKETSPKETLPVYTQSGRLIKSRAVDVDCSEGSSSSLGALTDTEDEAVTHHEAVCDRCGSTYSNKHNMKWHQSKNVCGSCDECGMKYKSRKELHLHRKASHPMRDEMHDHEDRRTNLNTPHKSNTDYDGNKRHKNQKTNRRGWSVSPSINSSPRLGNKRNSKSLSLQGRRAWSERESDADDSGSASTEQRRVSQSSGLRCDGCDVMTKTADDLRKHQRSCGPCPDCSKLLPTWADVKAHRSTVHPKTSTDDNTCNKCQTKFSSAQNRIKHQHKACACCGDCSKICASIFDLMDHRKSLHGEPQSSIKQTLENDTTHPGGVKRPKPSRLSLDISTTSSGNQRRTVSRSVSRQRKQSRQGRFIDDDDEEVVTPKPHRRKNAKTYSCKTCREEYSTVESLLKHCREQNHRHIFQCEHCNRPLRDRWTFEKHDESTCKRERMPSPIEAVAWEQGKSSGEQETAVKVEDSAVEDAQPVFECNGCESTFETADALYDHSQIDRCLGCNSCPEVLDSFELLDEHVKEVHAENHKSRSRTPTRTVQNA